MKKTKCSCIWGESVGSTRSCCSSTRRIKENDKKEEDPKQPKSTFKFVDPTLKSETWILKNSGLTYVYDNKTILDQNSLKFKFPTSKLDQQTWMLTLAA